LEVDAAHLQDLPGRYNLEVLEQKGEDVHILQVVGSTRRIDTFLDEVGQEHIIEIARTGVTALKK